MKILRVRFQNLNSLAGEWAIDFTHPAFAVNGIFAITGPTGSGKTTLLDAICLGLYGRTPRLARISEATNEIMSRQSGVCFSEVEFETNKGRFRCHWSQRRARQQAAGKLQQPRHEIADALTDQVLESKVKDVARLVDEVTGMDFDQFTRSVLLAQGGFAAFLQASADERAPILEQITGTGIYSRLSQKVHQRRGEEQQRLAVLAAENSAVVLLSADEEEVIAADLAAKKTAGEKISEDLRSVRDGQAWLTALETLKNDIAALEAEAEASARQLQEAEPEKVRLQRAQSVCILDGGYGQLRRLRDRQHKEGAEREQVRKDQEAAGQRLQEAASRHGEAERLLQAADQRYRQEVALCREVRELDVTVREAGLQAEALLRERQAAEQELQAHDRLLHQAQDAIARKTTELDAARQYLQENRKDEGLVEELAGLQELVTGVTGLAEKQRALELETKASQAALLAATRQAVQAAKSHQKSLQQKTAAEMSYEVRRQELTGLTAGRDVAALRQDLERLAERRHLLGRAFDLKGKIASLQEELAANTAQRQEAASHLEERGRRRQALAEKIAWQRQVVDKQEQIVLLAHRIRNYDRDRAQLADGSPCPLCGATVHPYVTTPEVRPDEAELVLRHEKDIAHRLQTEDAGLQAEIAAAGEKIAQAGITGEKLLSALKRDTDDCARLTAGLPPLPDDIGAELARIDAARSQGREFLQDLDRRIQATEMARIEAEKAREICNQAQQEMVKAAHAESLAGEDARRRQEEARQLAEELARSLERAGLRLASYGVEGLSPQGCDRIMAGLAGRQHQWRRQKEQEQRVMTELHDLQVHLERERALTQKQMAELDRSGGQLQVCREQLAVLQDRRRDIYGSKDPDVEEKNAGGLRTSAEQGLARCVEDLGLLEKSGAVLAERMSALDRSIAGRAEELGRDERNFLAALAAGGFGDEAEYNAARLTDERIGEIAKTLERLTAKEVEVKTLLLSKKEALRAESEKRRTDLTLPDLSRRIEEQTAALHALQQDIGLLQGRLRDNDDQRQKQQDRLSALARQRLECGRWQRLHELIGSGDGKKFRNFAQGVTFEIMVSHANRSLRTMTDRYILTRDPVQPLELNVIDTYQAGEVRSTKNLSGGESFIASLALALGLAGMAGKNVRVDSLFLDEGFGALDEDSLETALETLAGLQRDGKIIGIISHVPALQERIATRIQVTPGGAGRSGLQGPGITRR